jgi:hypothetical protein
MQSIMARASSQNASRKRLPGWKFSLSSQATQQG